MYDIVRLALKDVGASLGFSFKLLLRVNDLFRCDTVHGADVPI